MILKSLSLQHFRNYTKSQFGFDSGITALVGPNTAGKTNLIEGMMLLATGKSYRLEKDMYLVQEKKQYGRVKGIVESDSEEKTLEVVIPSGVMDDEQAITSTRPMRRYLVDNVSKRRVDFAGILQAVLFVPTDLDIIIAGPSHRRSFLDDVLEQVDRDYRVSLASYTKALRQRNALLEHARETGRRNQSQFEYWDSLLIGYGQEITKKREQLIEFINSQKKDLLSFDLVYDKSEISRERLDQYKDGEIAAGVTLVGPHRDNFFVYIGKDKEAHIFASRGQQRLIVLELKLLQLMYMQQVSSERPILLLDDIFSELDTMHIDLVLDTIHQQQTILTTTHQEFLSNSGLKGANVVELEQIHGRV